jgi:outer membrane lipoprotein-sorting protein
MRLHKTDHRAIAPGVNVLHFRSAFVILSLLILIVLWPASAQQPKVAPVTHRAPLTLEQVVRNLVQMNLYRVQALHAYQGTRTYRVEYHGFPGTRSAQMVVNVKYLSPGTKEFIVQSVTGSKVIIDKVFKKLLEAEKEALDAENQRRSAFTEDNYRFTLIGYESGSSGARYVLKVEPRTKNKFLYRGQIWVDAEDFAVVRLEAEPSKNPSFWTKNSEIEQVYMRVNDFWLPAYNRSVSAIRLGGHAELTIDYKDYEITGATRVSTLSMFRLTPHAETARAHE